MPPPPRRPAAPLLPYQLGQHSLAGAFLLLLVMLLFMRIDSEQNMLFRPTGKPLPPACRTLRDTGQPCPTCGLTRGLVAATTFDLELARNLHPAAVGLLGLFLLQVGLRPLLARARLTGPRAWAACISDFVLNFGLVLWVVPLANG